MPSACSKAIPHLHQPTKAALWRVRYDAAHSRSMFAPSRILIPAADNRINPLRSTRAGRRAWMVLPGFSSSLESGDDLADVIRNAAEIATLRAGVHIVRRLDITPVQIASEGFSRRNVATLLNESRYRRDVGGDLHGHRGVAELAKRAQQMLSRLDRDVVRNPGHRIGPEIGRDLFRRA